MSKAIPRRERHRCRLVGSRMTDRERDPAPRESPFEAQRSPRADRESAAGTRIFAAISISESSAAWASADAVRGNAIVSGTAPSRITRARRAGIAQRIQQRRARAPRAAPDVDAVVAEGARGSRRDRQATGDGCRGADRRRAPAAQRPPASAASSSSSTASSSPGRSHFSGFDAPVPRRVHEHDVAMAPDCRESTGRQPVPARARPGRARPPGETADRARRRRRSAGSTAM